MVHGDTFMNKQESLTKTIYAKKIWPSNSEVMEYTGMGAAGLSCKARFY